VRGAPLPQAPPQADHSKQLANWKAGAGAVLVASFDRARANVKEARQRAESEVKKVNQIKSTIDRAMKTLQSSSSDGTGKSAAAELEDAQNAYRR